MARGLTEALLIASLAAFLHLGGELHSASGERALFNRIKELSRGGASADIRKTGEDFVRRYPSSPLLGEVYLIMAENESDAAAAMKAYRGAIGRLRGEKALEARAGLCRILHLSSRWSELARESRSALEYHGADPRAPEFMLHLARASISTEEYEKAARLCEEVPKKSHKYEYLSSALLLLSYIDRKTTGYSRGYFTTLRDIVRGFPEADIAPTALYLLGRSWHDRGDRGRALSAYRKVASRFPRSPEAVFAAEKLASLEKQAIAPADHIPGDDILKAMDPIDLEGYRELREPPDESVPTVFSVSLGPVDTVAAARDVAKLIKDEFGPVRIVHQRGRYGIYAGRHRDTKSAMTMKIRLAEELGLNGRIVRIRRDEGRTYIYGD